jgi:hypothetical protein
MRTSIGRFPDFSVQLKLVQAKIQFSLLSLGERQLILLDGDTVPDVLDKLQASLDG